MLSPALRALAITLRPKSADDAAFLERLYIETRWDELTVASWPDSVKRDFLRSQFALQTRHYADHYAEASFAIVELHGQPVGRLYLHRGTREIRIVDISLLAERRGQGIGGALLRWVGGEAAAGGRIVSIHVEQFNPALTLYRRLGFQDKDVRGPYLLMEWAPVRS